MYVDYANPLINKQNHHIISLFHLINDQDKIHLLMIVARFLIKKNLEIFNDSKCVMCECQLLYELAWYFMCDVHKTMTTYHNIFTSLEINNFFFSFTHFVVVVVIIRLHDKNVTLNIVLIKKNKTGMNNEHDKNTINISF